MCLLSFLLVLVLSSVMPFLSFCYSDATKTWVVPKHSPSLQLSNGAPPVPFGRISTDPTHRLEHGSSYPSKRLLACHWYRLWKGYHVLNSGYGTPTEPEVVRAYSPRVGQHNGTGFERNQQLPDSSAFAPAPLRKGDPLPHSNPTAQIWLLRLPLSITRDIPLHK